jgi:3,4-dihydroxy-2-butanone 4-phosphate synthase
MSGSIETAALELRMGGMSIVSDRDGGTLVLGALFATGRVVEFIAREAHGPVSLALPAASGGVRVEPLEVSGTLPELDRRASAVRAVAEGLAASRLIRPGDGNGAKGRLRRPGSDPVLSDHARASQPAVSVARLDAALRLAELAGLSGVALVCPIRGESGAPAGPTALAAFGRCHDVPAIEAAAVLSYGPRRVRPRAARPRPRVVARARSYAQRLAAGPSLLARSG